VFGLNLFELTFMLPHGMLEFVLMGVVFMALGKHMTGSYRKPWGAFFVGRSWIIYGYMCGARFLVSLDAVLHVQDWLALVAG
jgi:hypothetical protein